MFRSWILNTFMLNKRQSGVPISLAEMNYKGCVSSKVKQYHWEILGPISRFDTTSKEYSFLDYCLVVKNYTILLTKTLRVEWVRKLLRIPTMIWIMRESWLHTKVFFGWDMKYKHCWPKNPCVDLFMKALKLEQTRKLSWNLHVREFVHEWESIMD